MTTINSTTFSTAREKVKEGLVLLGCGELWKHGTMASLRC